MFPLRIARKIGRLSLAQVARAAAVDTTFIWQLENEKRDLGKTGVVTVRRIAGAFNLTTDELLWLARMGEERP